MATRPTSTVPPDEVSDDFSHAEMQKQLDDLKAQLARAEEALGTKQVVLEEQKAELQKLKASKSGWLITAPNALYDGLTMGVQFVNGQAFIPDDRVIPQFVFKPEKEHEVEKNEKMTPEERIAYRERESVPSSVRAAQAMHNDFGYTVQHFDGEDANLQELMDARVKERAQVQALIDEQNAGAVKAAGLVQPNRYTTVPRG